MINTPENLYIIGNGFDMHHKINSSYRCFRDWMEKEYPTIIWDFEDAYGVCDEDWWSDFENNLASLDVISYSQQIASENEPNLLDDHCDAMWTNAQVYVEDTIRNLYDDLRGCFHKWIHQLEKPVKSQKIKLNRDNSAFLTFNYTKTLEDLYNIDKCNILHIHGCVDDEENFIFGHGKSEKEIREENTYNNISEDDTKNLSDDEYFELQQEMADSHPYHEQLAEDAAIAGVASQRKPVYDIINRNADFFNNIKSVKNIYVYGLSFSEVDLPYLEEVIKKVRHPFWEFSDYNNEIKAKIESFVKKEQISKYKIINLNEIIVDNDSYSQ